MEPNVTPTILMQDASPLFGGAGKPSSLPFPNPFVGLRPFKTEESLLFFGRNEQTIELLQRLYKTRFLAVVGSSGCGKSSLIRAGLIPKLKAGFLIEDRDRWLTATMKPTVKSRFANSAMHATMRNGVNQPDDRGASVVFMEAG